jgi:disulfide bond formation protein DsbB
MENFIPLFNTLFALGGIGIAFATLILLFDIYSKNNSLEKLVTVYGLLIAFIVTLGSSITTLMYSEIFGFIPCGLCWLQRVFLYPQVFLLGLALYRKDKGVALYGIVLSIPGLIVSLYQHYLQMGGSEFITCPKAGAGANCAERIMFEFGFVTFPLLSAFLFTFLIVLYFYIYKTKASS